MFGGFGQPDRTAILISDDTPGHEAVTDLLTERIPAKKYQVFNLDGLWANAPKVLDEVEAFSPDAVIAVGLLAAKTARQRPELPLIFCRVFNYQDHDLISPTSTGVKLLPPFELQLLAWKELAPDLHSIGVITGPDQEDLLMEITTSAELHDIQILSRTVSSDKEALFEFKRLIPLVEGLWVLPDNRILSVPVLEELMAYGVKHGKQLVVFNDQLLDFGALMSFTSDDGDVADQVLSLLRKSKSRATKARPVMLSLTTLHVELNTEVAQELGLSASPEFRQFLRGE